MDIQNSNALSERELIPISTHKNYDVAIIYGPNSKTKVNAISDLGAESIGSLVIVKAIVVRVS